MCWLILKFPWGNCNLRCKNVCTILKRRETIILLLYFFKHNNFKSTNMCLYFFASPCSCNFSGWKLKEINHNFAEFQHVLLYIKHFAKQKKLRKNNHEKVVDGKNDDHQKNLLYWRKILPDVWDGRKKTTSTYSCVQESVLKQIYAYCILI